MEGLTARATAEFAEALPRDDTGALLSRCATESAPDLAFRCLLMVLLGGWCAISGEQYDRLVLLGRQLGYPDSVVSVIEELIVERCDHSLSYGGVVSVAGG